MEMKQRVPLSDKISEQLLNDILDGPYTGAEYLPSETDLCEIFSASRATVRDAIRGLAERGVVERQHGRGIKIVNRTLEAVTSSIELMMASFDVPLQDILEVRKFLEIPAVRLAAMRGTDSDIAIMKASLDKMKDPATPRDEYVRNDLDFHVQIAKASRNIVLQAVFQSLAPILARCIGETIAHDLRPEVQMHYHENIFDAIVKRNPDRAEAFMRTHLEATQIMALEQKKDVD